MSPLKLIKIGADGQQLPDDATDHVAVLLPDHGLTFTATSVTDSDVSQEDCEVAAKACTLLGASDWDLPAIDELSLVIDRARYSPAINTDFFRDIQNDWYWTKTPAAFASSSAWGVYFGLGYVGGSLRGGDGFALAVRRSGQ